MNKLIAFFSLTCVGLICLTGCGGVKKPDGMPDLVKATITLTQEGQPLADADVTCFGKQQSAWTVFGRSDAKGVVELKTYTSEFSGAPVDEYVVCVKKIEATPSKYGDTPPPTMDEADAWSKKRAAEYRPSYYLVPEEFINQATSTLTLNVTADGVQPATLELGPPQHIEFIPADSAPKPGQEIPDDTVLEPRID